MKCLSRIEMQEFADKEVSPAAEAEIIDHLTSCLQCKKLLKEVNDDKSFINSMLSQICLPEDESPIPVFVKPVRNRKKILT